jgi:hypothetical protein
MPAEKSDGHASSPSLPGATPPYFTDAERAALAPRTESGHGASPTAPIGTG